MKNITKPSPNENIIIMRENIIEYIYSHELLNKQLDSVQAFESGEYTEVEIKNIEQIAKSYDMFKKIILQFTIDTWPWERMSNLTKAILIYGTFELSFNDKALVIDVLVQYTKNFSPDDSYKFVNSILEKVGQYYEAIKRSKK